MKLIMNMRATEKRVAIKEEDKVMELIIDRPTINHTEGNIYVGRVMNVLPGMQAAFVDIGQKKPGYIHRDHLCSFQVSQLSKTEKEKKNISQFVHQGEAVLVQVIKEAEGTKGPKLTGLLEFSGLRIVYQPYGKYKSISKKMSEEKRQEWRELLLSWCTEEEGVILRTSSENVPASVVEEELMELQTRFIEVQEKKDSAKVPALLHKKDNFLSKLLKELPIAEVKLMEVDDPDIFQQLKKQQYPVRYYQGKEGIFARRGIEQELEKALKKIVWLPSGGYIIIEHTEAMTVVDVNTGKFIGKTGLQETVLKTNLEAAKEIARQLRLRQIGGIIIIDFIDMENDEEREQVLNNMQTAVKKDRSFVRVIGFTELNLMQLTRKKVREPLTHLLFGPCEACEGKGIHFSAETIVYQLERELLEMKGTDIEAVIVETSASVAKKYKLISDLESRLGFKIYTRENEKEEKYVIRFTGALKEAKERLKTL